MQFVVVMVKVQWSGHSNLEVDESNGNAVTSRSAHCFLRSAVTSKLDVRLCATFTSDMMFLLCVRQWSSHESTQAAIK